jgi:membrane protease YdiL (CAAX protease family)
VLQVVVSAFWAAFLIELFFSGDVPDPTPIWLLGLSSVAIWVVYIIGPTLVTRLKGDGPNAELWPRLLAKDVPNGIVIGVALQLLVLPIVYWPILRLTDVEPGASAEELVDLIDGPMDLVILTVVVAIGAPLAEEFFYRGMLLQGLRRRFPDIVAVLVSSGLFALVHIQPILYPGTFVLGVVAAIATLKTRRLGMAWAMHIGFNSATLVTLLIG